MACTLHAEPSPQPCTGLGLPSPDPENSPLASLLILMSDWCCFCKISFFLLLLSVPVLGMCVGVSDFLVCSCQTSNRDSHCAFQPFMVLFKAFRSLLYAPPTGWGALDWRTLARLLDYSYGTYLNILRLKFGKGIQSHGANKEILYNEKFPFSISLLSHPPFF